MSTSHPTSVGYTIALQLVLLVDKKDLRSEKYVAVARNYILQRSTRVQFISNIHVDAI